MFPLNTIPLSRKFCLLLAVTVLAGCSQEFIEGLPKGNEAKSISAHMTPQGVVLKLPGCPDWTDDTRVNYTNTVHSNFGCANETNFGMRVANPADVLSGRDPGLADGTYAAGAIERYRKGETMPLLGDSTSATEPTSSGGGEEESGK